METQPLIPALKNDSKDNCICEEWSDSSSCSSCYSDSDSSVPEWESSICSNGELLYVDCDPVVSYTNPNTNTDNVIFTKENSTRHSTRSKFLKLLRRDSKRHSKRYIKSQSKYGNQDTNKVKFQDHEEGEVREVILNINKKYDKLGRRASLVESILGLTVSTLSDGCRIMVAGFIPDSEAARQKNIKIGDWMKCINNIELTWNNLNSVLEQIRVEDEVVLELQRVAGIEVTKNPPVNKLDNQSSFVQQLVNPKAAENSILNSILTEQPVGIVCIDTESISETGSEFEGVLYCYPQPFEKNLLCISRGVFITLNHLLFEITNGKPEVTSAIWNDQLLYVTYINLDQKLLLLMLPDNHVSAKEALLQMKEIIRLLEFMYQTINKCFETNLYKEQLDHFFSKFFARLLCSDVWGKDEQAINTSNISLKPQLPKACNFENVISAAHFLILPDESQMEISNALTELESSDYREWNEEPLDCQRLFTFLGSALYHSGYLLASHLLHEDLIDIHIFCRQQGLFHLCRTEPVRTLILWREVFPAFYNQNKENSSSLYIVPEGKRYLLVVGSRKDLLVVLMEAGGCTEEADNNTGPDPFYVEEAQATLAHLQDIGISNLADYWILNNPQLQVAIPEIPLKRKSDFLGGISFSKTSNNTRDGMFPIQRKPEITSILKRRVPDQSPSMSGANSSYSLADDNSEVQSEDSMSQGACSERSESDEPVLGRRAIKERKNYHQSDEESDIEDYREGSYSNSSYDLSELRHSLLAEAADIKPQYLTVGNENVLFYYVQLDLTEGILLCPPKTQCNSKTLENVLNNFRKCAQQVHKVFQNTLRFKEMLSQDRAKSVVNKSLIAIKEYGMLFECLNDLSKKHGKLTYWVTGRLFYTPHPKELYVCYQDTIPQNMIEIAFKLGISD